MKKEFIFIGILILVTFVFVVIGIISITGNVVDVASKHDHSSHLGHDGLEGESPDNEILF